MSHEPWGGVEGVYADAERVIIRFDTAATAKDGVLYANTWYFQIWYFQIWETTVVKAVVFLDTRDFDDFSMGVKPQQ